MKYKQIAIRILYVFTLDVNIRQGVKLGHISSALLNVNMFDMCRTVLYAQGLVRSLEEHNWVELLIDKAQQIKHIPDVFTTTTLGAFENLLHSTPKGI